MAYQPIPQTEDGGQKKVWTRDDEARELLRRILIELQIMNLHMESLSGERVKERDIDSRRL